MKFILYRKEKELLPEEVEIADHRSPTSSDHPRRRVIEIIGLDRRSVRFSKGKVAFYIAVVGV